MHKIGLYARVAFEKFRHRYVCLLFRLIAGITLVISGTGKLFEGGAFVEQVEEYDLLPQGLIEFYGSTLPWVEVVIGVLLILGLASRYISVISLLTILSFLIANSVVLYRGANMECGCFAGVATLETREALIIDCILLIMVFQILIHKGNFLNLDSILSRRISRSNTT